jgi:hypothetical protein
MAAAATRSDGCAPSIAQSIQKPSCAALVEDDPTERLMIVRVVGDTAADNNDDG